MLAFNSQQTEKVAIGRFKSPTCIFTNKLRRLVWVLNILFHRTSWRKSWVLSMVQLKTPSCFSQQSSRFFVHQQCALALSQFRMILSRLPVAACLPKLLLSGYLILYCHQLTNIETAHPTNNNASSSIIVKLKSKCRRNIFYRLVGINEFRLVVNWQCFFEFSFN